MDPLGATPAYWPEVNADASGPLLARKQRQRRDIGATLRRPLNRGAGRLVNCLSEFLAARQVINRSDRYEQMRDHQSRKERVISNGHNKGAKIKSKVVNTQRKKRDNPAVASPNNNNNNNNNSRLDLQEFQVHEPARRQQVKKHTQLAESGGQKCNVHDLFLQLLSGRPRGTGSNRLQLVGRLLRAPVVLAALFSFCLALSLITLYALSFHHCQKQRTPLISGSHHAISSRALLIKTTNSTSEPVRSRLVHTECGSYEAQQDGAGGLVFSGIAYASPPVGARRWQRPQPIWQDRKLCNQLKGAPPGNVEVARAHCVQLSPFNRRVSGAEDCLYLNIYAPQNATRSSKLPVMVYIHGGFLTYGSNGGPTTRDQSDGPDEQVNWMRARPSGQLASELNVLLVAPNYRLQALGFMAFGANASANFGLWDQVVALNWIARNIGQFGGDSAHMNLFGPDAAAALPLALASRQKGAEKWAAVEQQQQQQQLELDGLLRTIWLANPAVYFELERARASRHYAHLIRSQSVCNPSESGQKRTDEPWEEAQLRACLMRLEAAELTRDYLAKDDANFRLDDENSLPIRNIFPGQLVELDGELVERAFPFEAAATRLDKVHFLLGSTREAAAFWPCPRNLHHWTWLDFERYVGTSLNSFSAHTYKRARDTYAPSNLIESRVAKQAARKLEPAELYLAMVSDIRQLCPANELLASLTSSNQSKSHTSTTVATTASRYVVEWRPSKRLASSLAAAQMTMMIDRNEAADLHGPAGSAASSSEPMQFAFHHWDLLAFFGFQFESRPLEVEPGDLAFQRHLRALIRDLVWSAKQLAGRPPVEEMILFSRDERLERQPLRAARMYGERECAMWRDTLNHSYAWLS